MSFKIIGLNETDKALTNKRQYLAKLHGPGATKVLVRMPAVQKALDVARETLTKYPGQPRYPLRWMSDKQRIAVIIKLKRSNNLPYQRTRRLFRNWKGEIEPTKVIIANEAKDPISGEFYAPYVFGKEQQPFHADTGWKQENDQAARKIVKPITDDLFVQFSSGMRGANA